jgi:tRNA (mo5U34)-methyltransferase
MNISDIEREAVRFRRKLDQVKQSLGPQPFEWYRYDSLANLAHIAKLLTGSNRDLNLTKPVLDIGCADGDLAFFLESLGCQVTAIDYPVSNHNHMAGVRKLKEALQSRIQILSMDIDTQFALPAGEYGLAIVLGALYHLKNPFYLLETISKQATHMLLSTRIAATVPGVATSLKEVSVAYLLGDDELNDDNSNFWIFTGKSFRQLLKRTNWQPLDSRTFGDTEHSDPIHPDRDERVFCYAQSQYALANIELLEGWHEPEGTGWRWTKQQFSLRVQVPQGPGRAVLNMNLYVPPGVIEKWGKLTITPNGETFTEPGYHKLQVDLGPSDGKLRELHFTLSQSVPPDPQDNRERGIIVQSVGPGHARCP